jgi:PTS system nitrogen regulatory IIA component
MKVEYESAFTQTRVNTAMKLDLQVSSNIPGGFMDFRDLLQPEHVILVPRAQDKEKLLGDLAQRAAAALKRDVESILNPLLARENLGSTGLGAGFALPHARIPDMEQFFCLFAKLAKPVPFAAIDDHPVDLIFLLLMPLNCGSDHLKALAAISRHLRDKTLMARLRKAKAPDALYGILKEQS